MPVKTRAELEMENHDLRSALEAVYDRVTDVLADREEDDADYDEEADDE